MMTYILMANGYDPSIILDVAILTVAFVGGVIAP